LRARHARIVISPILCQDYGLFFVVVSWLAFDRILALGGACMIQMEKLVLDIVLSVIGDEAERLPLESDFDTVDVDQLAMTQIVLALERRLGPELPTNLEEAKAVARLVVAAQKSLASRPSPPIIKKTVWARWNGNEWVGARWSGEVVASNKYQEELIRTLRALASDPSNNILAIAPVSDPLSRKPKSNRPKLPPRPK